LQLLFPLLMQKLHPATAIDKARRAMVCVRVRFCGWIATSPAQLPIKNILTGGTRKVSWA